MPGWYHPDMKITDLMPMPLLLNGFDEPYTTVKRQPHFGPVHTEVRGESLAEHDQLQIRMDNNRPDNSAYVGFGGWVNLGYLAALKPDFAVLADINPLQAIYWQFLFNAIAVCGTIDDFETQLPNIERETKSIAERLPCKLSGQAATSGTFRDDFDTHVLLQKSYGFYSQDQFDTLKALITSGRISLAVLDIKDTDRINKLRDTIEDRVRWNAEAIVHVSNVLEFVSPLRRRDWAYTHCGATARNDAKANICKLAFGDHNIAKGTIIHTHTHAASGGTVYYTSKPELEYFGPGSVRAMAQPADSCQGSAAETASVEHKPARSFSAYRNGVSAPNTLG